MNKNKTHNSKLPRWMPTTLAVLAFACAALYSFVEREANQQLFAGGFGVLLGLALIGWGIEEYMAGTIRGKRRKIYRIEHPKLFYAIWFIKRIIPGSIMFAAGIWFSANGAGG